MRGETRRAADEASSACLTREGRSGKIAAATRTALPLGKVLSCRVFDLEKGAQRSEILLDRERSGWASWSRCDKIPAEDSKQVRMPI
jgi:hypothetical protein